LNSAEVLRLLTSLAENLMQNPDQDELSTGFGSMADHEVDEVAAVLMQLHLDAEPEWFDGEITDARGAVARG